MSKKPEARFKNAIHRLIPPAVYKQSMFTPYSNGTPDHYYEGPGKHLWVEYKWVEKIPLKGTTPIQLLSPQQLLWAKRAIAYRQPWACVLGVGTGREAAGALFLDLDALVTRDMPLLTKEEIAGWICLYVGEPTLRSTTSNLRPR